MKIQLSTSWMLLLCILYFASSCTEKSDEMSNKFSGEELFEGIYFQNGPVSQKLSAAFEMQPSYHDLLDTDEAKQKVAQIQRDVISTIKRENPDFFIDFATNIQSGDHLRVQNALDYGTVILQKTVANLPEVQKYKADIEKSQIVFKDLDISKFVKNKKIDVKGLETYVESKVSELEKSGVDVSELPSARQMCATFAIGVNAVIAVNVAVLINAAAGVNVALALNAAIGVNLAGVWNLAFFTPDDEKKKARQSATQKDLASELLVDLIAKNLAS